MIWATGSHGEYRWLTTDKHDLDTLLRVCPQAVLGKRIAVTSLDSGPLRLNADEVSAGWLTRNDVAYSPRIESVETLAHGECGGFDEWYVFEDAADLGQVVRGNIFTSHLGPGRAAVFVNYGGFGFHDASPKSVSELFWTQLEWIRPVSFIADGQLLNFVSRDEELFTVVLAALSDEPE